MSMSEEQSTATANLGPEQWYGYEGEHTAVVEILGKMTVFAADGYPPRKAMQHLAGYLEQIHLSGEEAAAVLDMVPSIARHTTDQPRDQQRLERGLYYWAGCVAIEIGGENKETVLDAVDARLQGGGAQIRRLRKGLDLTLAITTK